MGLDITRRKMIKPSEVNTEEHDFYTMKEDGNDIKKLEDCGLIEYITHQTNEYYDFDKFFDGHFDDWQWCMTSYDKGKCIFKFKNKKHDLAPILDRLEEEAYRKHPDKSDEYEFILTDEEQALIDKYGFTGNIFDFNKDGVKIYYPLDKFLREQIYETFNEEDIPVYSKEDKGIYLGAETGYQRKGMNSSFYENFKDGDYYVYTIQELEYIRDKYSLDDEYKEHFQKEIIDSFQQGSECVTFDW